MDNKIPSEKEQQQIAELLENNRTVFLYSIKRKFNSISSEELEDCLQDLYLLAYEHFNDILTSSNPQGWLFNAYKNIISNYQRKRASEIKKSEKNNLYIEQNCMEIEEDNWIFAILTRNLSDEHLKELILSKLSKQERNLYIMRYVKKDPLDVIAKNLKVPVGTVKSRLHTLRTKVQIIIQDGELFNFFK